MSIIYEYDPTGVPVSTMMYLMGVDMDATQTAAAAAPTTTDIGSNEVHTSTTGEPPVFTSYQPEAPPQQQPTSQPPPATQLPPQFAGMTNMLDMSTMSAMAALSGMSQVNMSAFQQFIPPNMQGSFAQYLNEPLQYPGFNSGGSDEPHLQ